MKTELIYLLLKRWISVDEVELIAEIIDHVWALVSELRDIEEAQGEDKRRAVVKAVGDWIDETLDDPIYLGGALNWKEMGEERRDRLISSVIEISLWLMELRDKKRPRRGLLSTLQQLEESKVQFKLIKRVKSLFED